MNNRQGMNSRLPYNSRAFSPQRMTQSGFNSSSVDQQNPFASTSSNNFRGNASNSSDFRQPFYQYRNESSRNDNFSSRDQRNQDRLMIWDDFSNDGSRNSQNYQQQSGSYSGYNSNNRSSTSSNFMPQASNYNPSTSMALDFIASLRNLNPQLSNSNQSQNSNFSNNFVRSSNQVPARRTNDRQSDREPKRDQRPTNNNNNNRQGRTQQFKKDSGPPPPREILPDIGEPTINTNFNDVFKINRVTDGGATIYSCLVCKIVSITAKSVDAHRDGKKHKYQLKLIEDKLPGPTKALKEKQFKKFISDKIYTHEPKFELLMKTIKHPLVGLEYVIELLDTNAKEQHYFCALCDKSTDPRTLENHLVSQTHRLQYLRKHFAPIMNICNKYRRFNEDLPFRQTVLIKICSKIESKTGRATAFLYEGSDFKQMKDDIFENVRNKKHVTIDEFPDAENYLLEGIELNDPRWEAENPPLEPKMQQNLQLADGVKRKRKVPNDVLAEYRAKVDRAVEELEIKLQDYEKDPDSHPHYKKEWEKFWNEKVDEMSKRGEDPTGHNFHEEWCGYFLNRIRELHKEEVEWKSDQIRKNLGLSVQDVGSKRSRNDSDRSDELFKDRKGRFHVSDDDDESFDEDFREFGPRIPKDVLYVKEKKIFNKFLGTVGIDPQKARTQAKPTTQTSKSNEPTSLVATCRILSTLEKELGLMAPKVLDLLSKSLAFEREHSKPADELLFDSENLNMLETVKEKLYGMQLANLIANNRLQACEKAINELSKLIEQHEVMVNIKRTLREMGKDEAAPEEIEMLKSMFMKKSNDDEVKAKRKRGPRRSQRN